MARETTLDNRLYSFRNIAYPAVKYIYLLAAGVLVLMMMLTTADVILRYFFNNPILGSIELTEMMMIVVIFFGLAYAYIHKGLINVDAVISRFPARTQAVIQSITIFATLGIFGIITWRSVVYAESLRIGNQLSPALNIPVFPFVYLAALGSAMICLILIIDFANHLNKAKEYTTWWARIGLMSLIIIVLLVFALPIWGQGFIGHVNPMVAGLAYTGFMIVMLFSGMPVAAVMALAGFLGFVYLTGLEPGFSIMAILPYSQSASYTNSVVPLFVLMGALCFRSGLSKDLYYSAYKWLGRLPGGLAIATIAGCAGFAAVSGSSFATAATMGAVAMPEMKKYGYNSALLTGSVAAGGTIGILIPPSIPMVIYGILTEQSIGKLFLAGLIPGILQAVLFMVTIYILCKRNPSFGPIGPSSSLKDKIVSLKNSWAVLALFVLVLGGIYFGIITPIEAAGVGAFGALFFALIRRRLSWKGFTDSLDETVHTTVMALTLLIGGVIFGQFLTVSRLPHELASMLSNVEVNRYFILAGIILVYIFLGCVMSSLAMIMITVPIFYPVIIALGFDPIWFGIMIVMMVEIGAITPPVGMNVFVIYGQAKDVPMYTIFRGIMPFLIVSVIEVALLTAVPQIVTILPNTMK